MNLGVVIVSAVIALAAITAATVAVLQGSIDGAAFTGIIGAAVGSAGAHAVNTVRNGNGKPTIVPVVVPPSTTGTQQ